MPAKKRVVSFLATEKTPAAPTPADGLTGADLVQGKAEREVARAGKEHLTAANRSFQSAAPSADEQRRATNVTVDDAMADEANIKAARAEEAAEQGAADMMDSVKRRAKRIRRP